MMPARDLGVSLIERLPPARGAYLEGAPLSDLTWFRVGGPADVLFRPADEGDLAAFLAGCPADVPVTTVGVGSNLLVRDGGVRGVVIRLGKPFAQVEAVEGHRVKVGAAALDMSVARAAQEASVAGLEFMRGIPGSVGGALRMNGGAYGREIKDALVEAVAIDRQGARHVLNNADMSFSYRHSGVADDFIFVEALLQGEPGERDAIAARMSDVTDAREASQPVKSRTGGSTFKNPPGAKAWELIDAAGCRGLKVGGAQVSEQHCNFLINTGDATAGDLEALGETVRVRVKETSGVELEWEIRRIGEPL